MIIKHDENVSYEVGKLVAETERYRLYLCRPGGETVDHLLQVASAVEHNGALDRAAYILEKLLREAGRLEDEYALVKSNPKHFVNYELCFPEIVDTFVPADQGGRRINILRFRGVSDVRTMVPLSNIVERDRLRVDMRTSIWIMGKLLKILTFVHSAGIAITNLTLGNILIEPEQHYVVIFNWADAQLMSDGVPQSTVREEIKRAACSVIEVLGGTPEGGIPDDEHGERHAPYEQHLLQLARNGASNAASAHQTFYALVDSLWARGFHKFTSHPR